MSATNGLASRGRLVVACLAIVFAMTALFASAASAKPVPITSTQLTLGDSLAFGYSQQLFNENILSGAPATAFEGGYGNEYFQKHHPVKIGQQLVNNGCPGETTDSLIGNGAIATALGIPGESPCGYHKLGLPLHHEYGGTKSQLESALEVLGVSAGSGKPVTKVTLNIGANDELRQIAKCEKEVEAEYIAEGKSKYGGKSPEEAVKNCILSNVKGLFTHIIQNIGRIIFVLREGGKFGSVNYTGPIVFLLGYDPYGVVYRNATEVEETNKNFPWMKAKNGEQLAESNALTGLLNIEEPKNLNQPGLCFANPQPLFNPGTHAEPGKLQRYTNMANTTTEPKTGKHNGPDIHPTPSGYKALANVMLAACE